MANTFNNNKYLNNNDCNNNKNHYVNNTDICANIETYLLNTCRKYEGENRQIRQLKNITLSRIHFHYRFILRIKKQKIYA